MGLGNGIARCVFRRAIRVALILGEKLFFFAGQQQVDFTGQFAVLLERRVSTDDFERNFTRCSNERLVTA